MSFRPLVRRRLDAAVVVAGLALFGLCALVAGTGRVPAPEREVFSWINGLPDSLTSAALIVTALKLIAERLVWQRIARERPAVTEPGAVIRAGTPTTGLSFVSGHVMLVTGLAWCATPYLRGAWRSAPWIVVALVGFARIYLGAHNPLDVLGGFGLGLAIGGITNVLVGVPGQPERRAVDA